MNSICRDIKFSKEKFDDLLNSVYKNVSRILISDCTFDQSYKKNTCDKPSHEFFVQHLILLPCRLFFTLWVQFKFLVYLSSNVRCH